MPRHLLQLDEGRVLVEQLRLLLGNVGMSVVPTFFLTILLLLTLARDDNAPGLVSWVLAVIASKLFNAWHARRTLSAPISQERAPRLAYTLMLLNALDGVAWGGLPWVTLDSASVTGTVLVIAVMAGVTSNAMSVLAPVLPVFLAFCVCAVAAIALKLSLMADPAYQALALISLVFVFTQVAQGRVAAMAARAAINLRFENVELIGLLREETGKARAARQEAEQANLAKSKFLAAASHDLRQPVHALGLFLEVIGRGELSPMQREMLGNARASSLASSEMLNTLLDFSRIEAGVIEPQVRPFHLQPLLGKIETELAPQAVAKGLVFRSRETHVTILSDPVLVELIVRNLVSNAIRYTGHGGVLLACRARGDQVLLEVWDTGVGIEQSQQQAIFCEFHQLGNPERDRNKGLGLGLAIVDGLVRTLGLQLTLCSRPGRGSLFRLTLPRSLVQVSIEEPAVNFSPVRALAMRVLVIDDDEAVRIGMLQLLRDWGCACEAVESIEAALEAARRHRPDIVISDYRLREQRTGAQAIAALRAELGADLPALLITGDTAPDRLREAQASGVPLLHKPVSPSLLYRRLVSMLVVGSR